MNITMTVTADTPIELCSAIKGCAALLTNESPAAAREGKTLAINSQPVNPTPAPVVTPVTTAPQNVPSAQVVQGLVPTQMPPAGQTTPVASPPAPSPTVPTTPAPAYTIDQLSRAGADLITAHPEHMNKLNAIMAGYGVQTIVQLPKEYYGDLALKLRELGAQI